MINPLQNPRMPRVNPLDPNGTNSHVGTVPGRIGAMPFEQNLLGGLTSLYTGGGAGGGGAGAGGQRATGGPTSAFDAVQKSIDQTNAANQKRLGQITGIQDANKADMLAQLKDLFGQIFATSSPTGALARNEQNRKRSQGDATAALQARGLGNTTLTANALTGVNNEADIRAQELTDQANQQTNGYRQQLASMLMDILQNTTRDKTGVLERVTDQGPDLGLLAQLYSQPGAVSGGNNSILPLLLSGAGRGGAGGTAPNFGGWVRPQAQPQTPAPWI